MPNDDSRSRLVWTVRILANSDPAIGHVAFEIARARGGLFCRNGFEDCDPSVVAFAVLVLATIGP